MGNKLNEVRQLNSEEIKQKLEAMSKELYELRYKASTSQVEKPHKIGEIRKDIARYKTILREKELANAGK